jgi:hypothetical protein
VCFWRNGGEEFRLEPMRLSLRKLLGPNPAVMPMQAVRKVAQGAGLFLALIGMLWLFDGLKVEVSGLGVAGQAPAAPLDRGLPNVDAAAGRDSPEAEKAGPVAAGGSSARPLPPSNDELESTRGEVVTIGSEGYGPHIERAWREGGAKEAAKAAEMLRTCQSSGDAVKHSYALETSKTSGVSAQDKVAWIEFMEKTARRCQTVTEELRMLEQALWVRAAQGKQPSAAAWNWRCLSNPLFRCGMSGPATAERLEQSKGLVQIAIADGDIEALRLADFASQQPLFDDPVQWRAHQIAIAELDRRAGRAPSPPLQGEHEGVRWRTLTAHERLLQKHPGFSADDEAKAAALSKAIVDRFPPAKRP